MRPDIVIVGGGLAGLALARNLQRANRNFRLVEARDRLGGRIKSQRNSDVAFDLGPSWFWPGQHRMEQLVADLGLDRFDQYSTGASLFEDEQGRIDQSRRFASMSGSWRLVGGIASLIDGLTKQIPGDRIQTNKRLTQIDLSKQLLRFADGSELAADQIVLTMPPRLVPGLSISPELDQAEVSALSAIPTWMAGHAKFFASFQTPFWRTAGLSGDVFSRLGPMGEIHDASPSGQDGLGVLFGFLSRQAVGRADQASQLTEACKAQLSRLFGTQAELPLETGYKDWATDRLTAANLDSQPLTQHPVYGMPHALQSLAGGALILCGTETAPDCGGFMEGALAAAERVAEQVSR